MANGTDIAKAYVQIIPSAEGIKGKLTTMMDGEAETAGQSAGGKFGKVFGSAAKAKMLAGGAAVATALTALVKSSVDQYAEYEQLVGGAQLLFGDAYDTIAEKAAGAYKTVQMSQNDYLRQVNGFATGLKEAMGGNAQAAADLADKIITAQADVVAATGASQEAVQNAFNGIMKGNFTMVDNLQLGITPTKQGYQEMIDKVNEWNAAQGRATNYTMDNLADMQSALVDYIEMQGLAGYAANEAADTIQGSFAMTKAAWSNMLTGIAADGADMEVLTQNLVDSIVNVVKNLAPRIWEIIKTIGTMLGDAIVKGADKLLTGGAQMIVSFIEGIGSKIDSVVSKGKEVVTNFANSIINAASQVVSAGLQIVKGVWQGISNGLGWIKSKIQGWVGNVVAFIKNLFGIHSPSTVMRDEVGRFMALGIGEGFENEMDKVNRMMLDSMPDPFSLNASVNTMTPATSAASGTTLTGDLAAIAGAIRDMKIYLDTGILVGAVDEGLQTRAMTQARRALA